MIKIYFVLRNIRNTNIYLLKEHKRKINITTASKEYLHIAEYMPEIISNMQRLTAIQIEQHGLTMLQFFILIRLFQENKEQKVSDISQSFDLPASSMTEMLDKLEKASLIKRNRSKDDRRVVLVETTKKTEQLHNNLARANLHFVNEILSKLTEKEKQTALKIFNVLHEYSRKLTEELYKYEEK